MYISRYIGLSDAVTIFRGFLFAIVLPSYFLYSGFLSSWVLAIIYGTGVGMDGLDGYIARKMGDSSARGENLDMWCDTLGFVVAPAAAVLIGKLPLYFLSLSMAKFVFEAIKQLESIRHEKLAELPDDDLTRYIAAAQMIFLTASLTPVVPREITFFLSPIMLTLSSSGFLRDYLYLIHIFPRKS
jgi:CDP-diacylglycerol--glycerol-3-phosphate 3-phosphatidyltransferase